MLHSVDFIFKALTTTHKHGANTQWNFIHIKPNITNKTRHKMCFKRTLKTGGESVCLIWQLFQLLWCDNVEQCTAGAQKNFKIDVKMNWGGPVK